MAALISMYKTRGKSLVIFANISVVLVIVAWSCSSLMHSVSLFIQRLICRFPGKFVSFRISHMLGKPSTTNHYFYQWTKVSLERRFYTSTCVLQSSFQTEPNTLNLETVIKGSCSIHFVVGWLP